MQSMISRISARAGSSVVDISVITPSPLNALPAKILTGSATSSIEIEVASGLPMLARIWRADASSVAPSGVASSIAASDSVSFPFSRSSGILEVPTRELHRRDQLAGAHPPVLVGVDQRQRPRVDLKTARRTGERDP